MGGIGVSVLVAVLVGGTAVSVGVLVGGIGVSVLVAVLVGGTAVSVGVLVGGTGVSVGVAVTVDVLVAVAVTVWVGVNVNVKVRVEVIVGVVVDELLTSRKLFPVLIPPANKPIAMRLFAGLVVSPSLSKILVYPAGSLSTIT